MLELIKNIEELTEKIDSETFDRVLWIIIQENIASGAYTREEAMRLYKKAFNLMDDED